jgi:hypothetical protein
MIQANEVHGFKLRGRSQDDWVFLPASNVDSVVTKHSSNGIYTVIHTLGGREYEVLGNPNAVAAVLWPIDGGDTYTGPCYREDDN